MKEAPTPEEMNKVIANMKKNHETIQKPQQLLDELYYFLLYQWCESERSEKTSITLVDKLQPKDIQKFAQSLFKGADVVDLIFKPKQ